MFELWQTILAGVEGVVSTMKMHLTPEERQALQDQNSMRQQALTAQMNYTLANTTSSTSTLGNYNISTASNAANTTWISPLQQYGTYPAPIDRLEKLEPGWYYIRWTKPENHDAEAYRTPIMALAIRGGSLDYVLGESSVIAQASATTPVMFLGIINPREDYDTEVWNAKARAAYYEWHAADVASRLLKGLAKV